MRRIATLLFCLLLTPSLFAQATNASVTGFIQDPTKAFIPGVTVTAVNVGTNAKFTTRTDKSGSYEFPSLPSGPYRMEIEKPGFKTILKEDLDLHVQSALEVNFQMVVGSSSESITVTGDTGNTTNGTVSTVISHEFIENMPLNGKDLQTLFELTPGTLLNAGGIPSGGGGFSVDGQRPTANYLTVDGASGEAFIPPINSNGQNTSGVGIATSASGGTNGILPIDAIEEYRMDTSTYTAENGRTPGGQIQVRTRSGTNQFHGTLFEDFRNQVLDATDWFVKYAGLKQSQLRMNDFGGTLGGPVIIPHLFDGRNRLFFFVANDNLVLDQPNTTIQSKVPDASIITSAYSVYKTWLSAFPAGNGGPVPGVAGWDYFNAAYPALIRDHTTSARVDWQLPRSIHAFFRANIAPSSSIALSVGNRAAEAQGSEFSLNTFTGGLTVPFGANMLDEFTINHTGNNTRFISFVPTIGGNSPDSIQDNLPSGVDPSLDNFEFEPYYTGFTAFTSAIVGPADRNELHQWNIVDTFSLHRGSNTLKFGVDVLSHQSILKLYRNNYTLEVNSASPSTNPDLAAGVISVLDIYKTNANPNISFSNTSLFANDNWKVSPSLTLNVGLRWELDPSPSVGPLGTLAFVGDNLNPATFQDALSAGSLYQTIYSNFAPRFGFAWTPLSKSGTVVRAGAGIYFDTGQAATVVGATASEAFPYISVLALSEVPYASFNTSSAGPAPIQGAYSPVYLIDPHLLSPRTYEWSLTIEQALDKHAKLTASYVGNDGEKLIGQNEYYNAANSSGQYPVNTTYVSKNGALYLATNQSHSNYQALQMQLTSEIGQRLNALVSYTWSHAEDNGSSDFSTVGAMATNPIANSANDLPQIFAAAIHYAPEGIKGNRIIQALTGGWGLDTIARLQSGLPLTVTYSNSALGNINSFTTNADVIPGVPTVLHEHVDSYGKVVPGNRLLNWAAFTAPPVSGGVQLRNGDSPSNGYRLFGLKQWDVAASRTWKIWERLSLNFRVDAYNLLNAVNFAGVSAGWNSANASSFGRSAATYAGANGALSSATGQTGQQLNTFQNGGARELQLSMKLKF